MSPCHSCGRPYDESFPDWTICGNCLREQIPSDSYVDSLGIVWSHEEIEEAGGLDEVRQMSSDSDIRKQNYGKN